MKALLVLGTFRRILWILCEYNLTSMSKLENSSLSSGQIWRQVSDPRGSISQRLQRFTPNQNQGASTPYRHFPSRKNILLNKKTFVLTVSLSGSGPWCEAGVELGLLPALERLMARWAESSVSISAPRPTFTPSPRSRSESVSAMLSVSSWRGTTILTPAFQKIIS